MSAPRAPARGLGRYARLVALPHTVFALPFALGAAALAWRHGAVAVLAGAPAAHHRRRRRRAHRAMGFNRVADRRFDAANPRTANRELPRGAVSLGSAGAVTVAAASLFVAAAALLGRWPLALVADRARHPARLLARQALHLGDAPVARRRASAARRAGAWIAITNGFGWAPLALSLAVAALGRRLRHHLRRQDVEFDRAPRPRLDPGALRRRPRAHRISCAARRLRRRAGRLRRAARTSASSTAPASPSSPPRSPTSSASSRRRDLSRVEQGLLRSQRLREPRLRRLRHRRGAAMIVLLRAGASAAEARAVEAALARAGAGTRRVRGPGRLAVEVVGPHAPFDDADARARSAALDAVESILAADDPNPRVTAARGPVTVDTPRGPLAVGADEWTLMLGPCAVENEPDLVAAAAAAQPAGARLLRGGAFKPRTSPVRVSGPRRRRPAAAPSRRRRVRPRRRLRSDERSRRSRASPSTASSCRSARAPWPTSSLLKAAARARPAGAAQARLRRHRRRMARRRRVSARRRRARRHLVRARHPQLRARHARHARSRRPRARQAAHRPADHRRSVARRRHARARSRRWRAPRSPPAPTG